MWVGDGEDYLLAPRIPVGNDPPPTNYIDNWRNLLLKFGSWGLNTVRLSFRFADAPAVTHSVLDYAKMDEVINFLSTQGYKVILDMHNYNDCYDWVGSRAWIDDCVQLADHYKANPTVLAVQPCNEPFSNTWAPNVTDPLDIPRVYAQLIDAIRATGNAQTVILPDPMIYGDSSFTIPSEAIRDNVVLSKHLWCSGYVQNDYPGGWEAFLNDRWSRMLNFRSRYNIPVLVGELGCYAWGGTTWAVQKVWMVEIINRCLRDNMQGFWFWFWSKNCHYCNELGHPNANDEVLEASNYSPSKYIIAVRTSPPINALVTVNGSSYGAAPVNVEVAEGMHTISISKEVT